MLRESGRILALVAILLSLAGRSDAIERPILLKETAGRDAAPDQQGCPLEPNLTGDCGNLRYYNLCSGYLWIYSNFLPGEGAGVRFSGPCISGDGRVERAITYWRNVAPGYGYTVDILLDADSDGDDCPNYNLARQLDLDPALRWNCFEPQRCIPDQVPALVLRAESDGGVTPGWATDGPRSAECDPIGSENSFYYGFGGDACVPWRIAAPTGRADNFLFWLIVDSGCATATEPRSWGAVKGLFR